MKGITQRAPAASGEPPRGGATAGTALGDVLFPVARFFPVGSLLSRSGPGLFAAIRFHLDRGHKETAARLAIAGLQRYRNRKAGIGRDRAHRQWWRCLAAAVEALGDEWHDDLRASVLELTAAPPRTQDPEAARTLVVLAHWKSDARDYEGAHALAVLAAEADPDWAEPDFLLGWYGLLLARLDAAEHLGRAVEKDHRMLFRIANDPICKRRPHIVEELKKRSLAGGIVIEATP